jgi:hypothetical protein
MPASAEGETEPPSRCQDVNGDGAADISDAVYLLGWLFLGGPAPECSQPPASPCAIPASGETLCYDTWGNEISCDSEEWPRQVGLLQPGCPTEGRFVVPEDDDTVVIDTCTGLMWERETLPEERSWQEALQYCAGLDLGGYDNWRLPGFRELQTLTVHGFPDRFLDPVFELVADDWVGDIYWTSSSARVAPKYAATVNFSDSYFEAYDKTSPDSRFYVRAVRTMGPGEW